LLLGVLCLMAWAVPACSDTWLYWIIMSAVLYEEHILGRCGGVRQNVCAVLRGATGRGPKPLWFRVFLFWLRCRYFWFLRGVLLSSPGLIVVHVQAELSACVHSASSKTSSPLPRRNSLLRVCWTRKGNFESGMFVFVCLFIRETRTENCPPRLFPSYRTFHIGSIR
jgi:hypothetical protein